MKRIKIGGVPEYFNHPIQRAIEKSLFRDHGIELEWISVPEGTGKMANSLQEGSLDLAVILTEGIIRSMALGNTARIVSTFVESPLIWGVHVSNQSEIYDLNDVKVPIFAVSRMGSGSHLMASLLATSAGIAIDKVQFKVVDNLGGARLSLKEGSSNLFLWEKYTTDFLVQNGEFRRIRDYPTPWPCFVIAASRRMLKDHASEVAIVIDIILQETQVMLNEVNLKQEVATKYDLNIFQVEEFLSKTRWSTSLQLPLESSKKIPEVLSKIGLIPANISGDFFYHF